jgi:hypothetical protein
VQFVSSIAGLIADALWRGLLLGGAQPPGTVGAPS